VEENMKPFLFAMCVLISCIFIVSAEDQVSQLSWIAGHWHGELWGGKLEEIWTATEGDCMMGMFRFVKDNKVKFYEFLTIEQESEGPVLKLKHFNRGLKGWEEKDVSIDFPLLSSTTNEAVFQRKEKDTPTKMIFRLKDRQTLIVILENLKDGKWVAEEFVYSKARS
jgi:hypothetical protein